MNVTRVRPHGVGSGHVPLQVETWPAVREVLINRTTTVSPLRHGIKPLRHGIKLGVKKDQSHMYALRSLGRSAAAAAGVAPFAPEPRAKGSWLFALPVPCL